LKAAVIGAGGFIGRHLCDTLIGRGDSVTALVRKPSLVEGLAGAGISTIVGDLADEDSLCRTCADADVVFNLAGALGRWGTSITELERINVQGAQRLVLCAAKSGAGRVIHVSTAGVSGPLPCDMCASEDYPPSPATDYQRTKLAGEQSAVEAHHETGIPLVIARPAFVYGPGDMHKLALFRAVARRRVVLVNQGAGRLHPIFVDDVVQGLITASERAPGNGETYILAGQTPIRTRGLLHLLAAALGVPPPGLSLPGNVLVPLALAAELVGRMIGREPSLTRSRIGIFSEHYAYSIEKAGRELGFKPLVSLPQGLARTVQWYRTRGLM